MKKIGYKNWIIFFVVLHCIEIFPTQILLFESHKNKDGSLKRSFLQYLIDTFGVDTFIETGTYSGNTTYEAAQLFKQVHTVELGIKMYEDAKKRFQFNNNVSVYYGDSWKVLIDILPSIKGRPVFWLDAHYCGVGTAMGKNETPILQEIESIKQYNIQDCIILIDDIRGFGTTINSKMFYSCPAYPSVQDCCSELLKINQNFVFALIGDKLLAYDATLHKIDLSPVAHACSISRLNELDATLLFQEQIIAQAMESEASCINWVYSDEDKIGGNQYHGRLWKGLMLMFQGDNNQAYIEFKKVIDGGYDHWRVLWYAAQAARKIGKKHEAIEFIQKVLLRNSMFVTTNEYIQYSQEL